MKPFLINQKHTFQFPKIMTNYFYEMYNVFKYLIEVFYHIIKRGIDFLFYFILCFFLYNIIYKIMC